MRHFLLSSSPPGNSGTQCAGGSERREQKSYASVAAECGEFAALVAEHEAEARRTGASHLRNASCVETVSAATLPASDHKSRFDPACACTAHVKLNLAEARCAMRRALPPARHQSMR